MRANGHRRVRAEALAIDRRWLAGEPGSGYPARHEPLVPRFSKFVKVGGRSAYWAWLGCVSAQGHPLFSLRGRKVQAARLAWAIARGPLRRDERVRHTCSGGAKCLNPAHMALERPAVRPRQRPALRRALQAGVPMDRLAKA